MWGRGDLIYWGSVPLRKKQPNCCASNALNRIYKSFSIRFPTHTCSVSTFFLPPVGDSSSSPLFCHCHYPPVCPNGPFPLSPSPPAITSKKMASPPSPVRSGCVLLNSLISFHDLILCVPSSFFTHVQYIHRGKRRTSYGEKAGKRKKNSQGFLRPPRFKTRTLSIMAISPIFSVSGKRVVAPLHGKFPTIYVGKEAKKEGERRMRKTGSLANVAADRTQEERCEMGFPVLLF